MKRNRFLRVLKIVVLVAVAITVFSFVTMHLWNWLMPAVFGLQTITWLQALGLLVLGKILFGGFHRHGGGCRAGRNGSTRHGGAVGGDESRGAREVSRGDARTVGLRIRSGKRANARNKARANEREERLNAVTSPKAEPDGVRRGAGEGAAANDGLRETGADAAGISAVLRVGGGWKEAERGGGAARSFGFCGEGCGRVIWRWDN